MTKGITSKEIPTYGTNSPMIKLDYCSACGEEKDIGRKFYKSKNPAHKGHTLICKDCIRKKIYRDDNKIDKDKMKKILKEMDLPWLENTYQNALNSDQETFGVYIRLLNTVAKSKGKKFLVWEDGETGEKKEENINVENTNDNFVFDVTEEMRLFWGRKYNNFEYFTLEDFFKKMEVANTIETPQDRNYLKKLAVISMKMDEELENGNYDEAKKLGDLYSKYMADSKFRAMDKTDADKTGGIRNFCTIYKEVESDDFIPPWEYYRKLKGISQDIIDKTIMHIENFTLRVNKIERMTTPPKDTPKLGKDEIEEVD